MPLTDRQQILYQNYVDLWRRNVSVVSDGTVTESFTKAYSNVQCYKQPRSSLSSIEEFGRAEHDIFGTHDIFHFAEDQAIDDTWVIVDKTPGSSTLNKCWVCRGNPTWIQGIGDRQAGKRYSEASYLETPPDGITP